MASFLYIRSLENIHNNNYFVVLFGVEDVYFLYTLMIFSYFLSVHIFVYLGKRKNIMICLFDVTK